MEEPSTLLELTFPFKRGVEYDAFDRYPFWSLPSTIEWFQKRGYTLYTSIRGGESIPTLPYETFFEAKHPYACYDTEVGSPSRKPEPPLLAVDITGKIFYAQDTLNRHVAIKLILTDSEEYRILKFLNEQPLKTLEENCILPVLELLPNGRYCFVVMPRWGNDVWYPTITRLKEVIDMIHCMLKGLVFLHGNDICHGDISLNNILINHFSTYMRLDDNETRKKLRLERRLTYAYMDYDHSYMVPPNMTRKEYRLPYNRSWGTWNWTDDAGSGEFDYDPFILDVGTMGAGLCMQYQGMCEIFPALAPLLDMMTAWDVRRRFTASQALEFFEAQVSELTEDQLEINIEESSFKPGGCPYQLYDRWQHLPPDLVERWKMYKETPQPWTRRLMLAVCQRPVLSHVVPWTRWFFFQVFYGVPHRIYNWLFPSKIQL